jgi:ribosomal protein S18 acetylase RimI-like enzyme
MIDVTTNCIACGPLAGSERSRTASERARYSGEMRRLWYSISPHQTLRMAASSRLSVPDGRHVGMICCALMAVGHEPEPRGTSVATTEIRPADGADLSAVVACVDAAYNKYIVRIGRKPAPVLADYAALIARGVVHVLPDPITGDLRGLIVLWPTDGALFVENVAVHPRSQGQGFGHRLMAFAEEQARAANLPEVRLYANEAMTENLAFYGRLGFEETGRRVEDGYMRVFLRKILGQH